MSAFVLPNSTTSQMAISILAWCSSQWSHPLRQLEEQVPAVNDRSGKIADRYLAAEMHRLNCYAVHCRYGTPESNCYRFQYGMPMSPMHLYKALGCWLYQCAEGDANQQPLYVILKRVHAEIGNAIIQHLPEYQKLPWS